MNSSFLPAGTAIPSASPPSRLLSQGTSRDSISSSSSWPLRWSTLGPLASTRSSASPSRLRSSPWARASSSKRSTHLAVDRRGEPAGALGERGNGGGRLLAEGSRQLSLHPDGPLGAPDRLQCLALGHPARAGTHRPRPRRGISAVKGHQARLGVERPAALDEPARDGQQDRGGQDPTLDLGEPVAEQVLAAPCLVGGDHAPDHRDQADGELDRLDDRGPVHRDVAHLHVERQRLRDPQQGREVRRARRASAQPEPRRVTRSARGCSAVPRTSASARARAPA